MNEKVFRTMNQAGTVSLVLGILTVVIGVVTGVLLIIHGAMLLREKKEVLF